MPRNKFTKFFCKHWIIILTLLIHFILLTQLFPLSVLFDSEPIVNEDYPFRLYKAMKFKETLLNHDGTDFEKVDYLLKKSNTGDINIKIGIFLAKIKLMSFDKDMYLINGVFNEINKLFPLLATILFFVNIVYLHKFFIFLTILLIPILIYFTGKNFGLNKKKAGILSLLSIVLIHFDFYVMGLIYWGLYPYFLSIFISLFILSYLYKNFQNMDSGKLILIFSLILLALLIHGLSLLTLSIFLFIATIYFFINKDEIKIKKFNINKTQKMVLFILALFLLIIVSSLAWAYIAYQNGAELPTYEFGDDGRSLGIKSFLWEFNNNPLRIFIYFLGGFSLFSQLWKHKKKENKNFKHILYLILISSILLLSIGYFGSSIPFFGLLKPRRLTMIIAFLLLFPLSLQISDLFKNKKEFKKNIPFLLIFIILSIILIPNFKLLLDYKETGQLSTNPPQEIQNLLLWINQNTKTSDTIWIEGDSKEPPNTKVYGGTLPSLFNYYTNRSYLSIKETSHTTVNLFPEYLYFKAGKINNKLLDKEMVPLLLSFASEVSVDWIVVWSEHSKNFLNTLNFTEKKADFGDITIYQVNNYSSFSQ